MHCISPIKASFDQQGDITYNSKNAVKGLLGFEFQCRDCLPCRLNTAREKAIRCLHESKMHKGNSFITLTYSDEHLPSDKLKYEDFQKFMRALRQSVQYKTPKVLEDYYKITYMVTGEYGEKKKRPHWHAILFNYWPSDAKYHRKNERGDKIYTSKSIDKIWGKNDPKKKPNEIGTVSLDSAGYVARYASKKLIHGKDQEHDYHPIHKTSSAKAIGRSWIEKYYPHTFGNGFVVLPNGQTSKIPRYYVDWLKKHKEPLWIDYVTNLRPKIMAKAEKKARKEELEFLTILFNKKWGAPHPLSRNQVELTCLKAKFKQLQEKLSL